jgi:two-component system sensor histidine kinase ChvG
MALDIVTRNPELLEDGAGPSGDPLEAPAPRRRRKRVVPTPAKRRRQRSIVFSRLTGLIVLFNLVGLIILILGTFALGEMRQSLLEGRIAQLRAQGEAIADVLADNATQGDPPRLVARDARTILRNISVQDNVRIRLFSTEGDTVTDSLLLDEQVIERDLPSLDPTRIPEVNPFEDDAVAAADSRLSLEAEFARALEGEIVENRRENEGAERVVSVSIPVQRVQKVVAVLTIEGAGVDAIIAAERRGLAPFMLVALGVTLVSSLLITLFVAHPIRKLANAADMVREAGPRHASIPNLSSRRDEVGDLSVTLNAMTNALAERIDAIERFAADVAHEIKNPLTSIRSAIETMPKVADESRRERLLGIVRHDVQRIDRLITDISNASRLDAELARTATEPVDLVWLLTDVVDLYGSIRQPGEPEVLLVSAPEKALVQGAEEPLGQVFRNLIDNAKTFSPPGGAVRVTVTTQPDPAVAPGARVMIDDDGPGVPEENLERIFDRFYTERPKGAAFGSHSGLGLAIARQIVASHQGRIRAENRRRPDGSVAGARFIVDLPVRRR